MRLATNTPIPPRPPAAKPTPEVAAGSDVARRLAMWIAGALFLVVAAATAYYIVFSQKLADDEGYLMISVRGFLAGHPLFDAVFTQYGPAYYFYEWLLHKPLGVPLTHDATRLLCIGHLLAAASVCGWACARLTRTHAGGVLGFMLGVVHLLPVLNEPGHPQEIVAVLLALSTLALTRKPATQESGHPHTATLTLLALIGVALAFIKVNVGAFLGFAWFLCLRCAADDALSRPRFRWLFACASALFPLLLMRQHLGEPWCLTYALTVSAGIFAVTTLGQAMADRRKISFSTYARLSLAWLVPSAILGAATLGLGTSPRGLLEGLLLTPLRMPGVAVLPMPASPWMLINTLAGLLVAMLAMAKRCPLEPAIPWLKALFGIAGAVLFIREPHAQINVLLPWCWLVLLPPTRGDVPAGFARLFLALGASWQALQAYPVAGTQAALGTLLMVPLVVCCITDAVRSFLDHPSVARDPGTLLGGNRSLTGAALTMAMLFVFSNVWCQPAKWRTRYEGYAPLNLPGSERVRLEPAIVEMYQPLMQFLTTACDTFVTYPGFNSFYFWTGKQPPTQINSTGWGQLSHAQQQRILSGLAQSARPLLVIHEYAMRSWVGDGPEPIRPLVQFVHDRTREVRRIGPFVILEIKPDRPPAGGATP